MVPISKTRCSIISQLRAPVNGTVFLTTTNSDFDTLLAVYTGDGLTHLALVASNDDAFPESDFSQLTTAVVSNQLYYIAVDGYGGTYGNVRLQYILTTVERYFSLAIDPPLGGTVSPPSGLYLANTTLYLTVAPARDFEFIGWSGAVNSTANPVTLLMNQNYSVRAMFRLNSYTEGFGSGGLAALAWMTSGNAAWRVQSEFVSGGRFAAQSGPVGDNQQNVIQASSDLANWTSLSTNVADSGTIRWTDPQLADQPRRFYRALAP